MKNDLPTARQEYTRAAKQHELAQRSGGLREFAGTEFAMIFRREQLNDSLVVGVLRLESKCSEREAEIDALGEVAAHFVPTIQLACSTACDIRAAVIQDHVDRVALANRVEELDEALDRFAVKLQTLKAA